MEIRIKKVQGNKEAAKSLEAKALLEKGTTKLSGGNYFVCADG